MKTGMMEAMMSEAPNIGEALELKQREIDLLRGACKELLDTLKLVAVCIGDKDIYHAVTNYSDKPQVTLGMRIKEVMDKYQ